MHHVNLCIVSGHTSLLTVIMWTCILYTPVHFVDPWLMSLRTLSKVANYSTCKLEPCWQCCILLGVDFPAHVHKFTTVEATMLAMLHVTRGWFSCTRSQVHNRTCMLVPCYQCCMLFGLILLHTFTSSQPYLHAGTMLSMLHVIWVDFPAHVHTFTTVPNLYAGTMLAINYV